MTVRGSLDSAPSSSAETSMNDSSPSSTGGGGTVAGAALAALVFPKSEDGAGLLSAGAALPKAFDAELPNAFVDAGVAFPKILEVVAVLPKPPDDVFPNPLEAAGAGLPNKPEDEGAEVANPVDVPGAAGTDVA